MKRFSDTVYDALRSVKLATVLIVLIAVFAVAGGIIPQGRDESFYLHKFPGAPARIILALDLDGIFSGMPFLLLATLFTTNLTVCSFHRFTKELKKPRGNRRHGPDILHIGLLVFIFGGLLTARTRSETLIYLGKGQEARLPEGSSIVLMDLREERYPDGRPKSWESAISIDEKESTIKVNSPLRYKGYTIYQQDWKSAQRAVFEDAAGMRLSLDQGAKAKMAEGSVFFMTIEKGVPTEIGTDEYANAEAVFLLENDSGRKILRARKGDAIGLFTFAGFEEEAISGLKIVRDKGFPLVAAGLALVLLGTFLTYIRKLKGMLA